MGWYYSSRWPRRRDLIDAIVSPPNNGIDPKIIRYCCTGNNLWALKQRVDLNGIMHRYIVLYKLQKHSGSYPYWGYKDMDECMGLSEHTCPISYIDSCTEPYNEYSRNWREEVRKYHVGITQKLKPGDCFVLYDKAFEIVKQKPGNSYVIRELNTHAIYSLPRKYLANIHLITEKEK